MVKSFLVFVLIATINAEDCVRPEKDDYCVRSAPIRNQKSEKDHYCERRCAEWDDYAECMYCAGEDFSAEDARYYFGVCVEPGFISDDSHYDVERASHCGACAAEDLTIAKGPRCKNACKEMIKCPPDHDWCDAITHQDHYQDRPTSYKWQKMCAKACGIGGQCMSPGAAVFLLFMFVCCCCCGTPYVLVLTRKMPNQKKDPEKCFNRMLAWYDKGLAWCEKWQELDDTVQGYRQRLKRTFMLIIDVDLVVEQLVFVTSMIGAYLGQGALMAVYVCFLSTVFELYYDMVKTIVYGKDQKYMKSKIAWELKQDTRLTSMVTLFFFVPYFANGWGTSSWPRSDDGLARYTNAVVATMSGIFEGTALMPIFIPWEWCGLSPPDNACFCCSMPEEVSLKLGSLGRLGRVFRSLALLMFTMLFVILYVLGFGDGKDKSSSTIWFGTGFWYACVFSVVPICCHAVCIWSPPVEDKAPKKGDKVKPTETQVGVLGSPVEVLGKVVDEARPLQEAAKDLGKVAWSP